ncbi:MAG: SIR2 family protein [Bacteroidetes bacterium]|nr:SIR2 family protein [Bacteroidota bacterium]
MNNYFDPREYIRGLQQIFISDTKRVGFLFGAGTSFAIKKGASDKSQIPGIIKMTDEIINEISKEFTTFKSPLEKIQKELSDNNLEPTIEHLLSNITQKHVIIGDETLAGLKKEDWKKLKEAIEDKIKGIVSVHKNKKEFLNNFIHSDFALWIKNSGRKEAVEIFTTNYDYLFEIGLEHNEEPYYDGFIGSYYPFFFPASVEDMKFLPSITKLWKLHGSLGWKYDEKTRKITRSLPDDSNIMVYPSFLKYDNSKKQPYVSFMDRLSNFIKEDDGVLFICGYSFGDYHINDVIINAIEKSNTSHIVIFYYDKGKKDDEPYYSLDDDCEIKRIALTNKKISVYGMNSAIIGGKYGIWKLKDRIQLDEDAVLLDLFFEDSYSEEGFLPKKSFTRIDEFEYEKSKILWNFLKDKSIIDDKGILTKDYETLLNGLKFESSFNDFENEIREIVHYYKGWNGEGEFMLPDFSHFINFLQNLNSEDYIKKIGRLNDKK